MVNSKPSKAKNNERILLVDRYANTYRAAFATNWNAIQKEINNLGAKENHWDVKYNTLPFGKGWQSYLEEDFEEGGKDAKTAEKNADDELEARIEGVSDVFCKAVVNYYSDAIKYETSRSQTQMFWSRLESYVNDTTNHNAVEKGFLSKDPLKKLIDDARTKAAGTTPTPPSPPTGTDDWEHVGMGQRYCGKADLGSVGFCWRYLKTN